MTNQPTDTFTFPRLPSLTPPPDNIPTTLPDTALANAQAEIDSLRAQLSKASNDKVANANSVVVHCDVCGTATEATVPDPESKHSFTSADSRRVALPCGHYSVEMFASDNLPVGKVL